ncbi:unnamed protein product [Sphagnum jensenii]|uniref:Transposase n=1 Tax=Sphagnum jensenii TaxID=128206 RepID=A0ABP1BDZ5_9BRYO
MIKLHHLCIQDTEFQFVFGCSPHALHNLCMDLVKEFPVVKLIVKQIVFLVKSVCKTHLIQQLFDKICKEKYGITLVLILFTKTRWGTVRNAAKRLNRVRTAMCQMPTEIMSNDQDVDLPDNLRDLILTATFWKGVTTMEMLFSAICSCLSYLEGDESTFSSVYTCFLAVAHHFRTLPPDVRTALDLSNVDVDKMHTLVCHRFKTIFSLAYALAFRTDPLFDDMCDNLAKLHKDVFLNLGELTILQQCKKAIKRMAVADILLNKTMQTKFGLYTICVEDDDDDFANVFSMLQHMWALANDSVYSHLKKLLLAIHKMPTGASAGERNHKSANRVHSHNQSRLAACKVEASTAIIFNAQQLTQCTSVECNGLFVRWLKKLDADAADVAWIDEENDMQEDREEDAQESDLDDHLDEFNEINLSNGLNSFGDECCLIPTRSWTRVS